MLTNLVITPSSVAPQCGSNVTFTSSVTGLPPIAYQWYDKNTNVIPGATNASYTLAAPTDASAGNYTLIAQNAYNSVTNVATSLRSCIRLRQSWHSMAPIRSTCC